MNRERRAAALFFVLAGLSASVRGASDAPPTAKNTPAIQQYYDEALKYYATGDYRMAVMKWTEILKEDADQRSAQTMILEARQKIAQLTRKRRLIISAHIASGRYSKARHELQALLDQDPGDPQLVSLQARLESVIQLAPQIAPADKAATMAILGLKGFLGLPPDHRLAHNALRYACELSMSEHRYDKFLALLLAAAPSLANEDAVTPGMKFLEYKHFVAIHQIYDAKYHLAVGTLGEILVLEPDDLMALKRLGSAYFSLGRMTEARKAWGAALALAPKDKTLLKFMKKTRTYKSNARTP